MNQSLKQPYLNMFCLPAAGNSAALYSSWKKCIDPGINLIPLEYPGHGTKVKEPLISNPDTLAQIITTELLELSSDPFILFGHSVGAALLWRMVTLLKQKGCIDQLKLIVVSSRPEPTFIRDMPPKHALSREQIIKELKKYNQFPEEIFQQEETFNFFLKIIRNDFYLSDQMLHDTITKTHIPLLAFYGAEDPDIPQGAAMEAWQQHSNHWLGCYRLPGDHFYFQNNAARQKMLDIIATTVLPLTTPSL